MKGQNKKNKLSVIGRLFSCWIPFFLLMSFVITCCMLLFLNTMSMATETTLTKTELSLAAKMTFLNVVFLSLVCTVIDIIRRKYTVEKPVKKIVSACERIMRGDLSVRIQPLRGLWSNGGDFNEIISYFNKMAEELSGMETLRTDFTANVSHELKTPKQSPTPHEALPI